MGENNTDGKGAKPLFLASQSVKKLINNYQIYTSKMLR
jgi:hypothetical protein